MAARKRERNLGMFAWGPAMERYRQTWLMGAPYGPWTTFTSGGSGVKGYEVCVDTVNRMPYPDASFDLDRIKIERLGTLQGTITDSTSYATQRTYSGQPFGPFSYTDAAFRHLLPGGASSWKNRALARANPNRPDVDTINFIWELRDIASLLHKVGRNGPSASPVGEALGIPISVRFGWGPLISDLQKLLRVANRIDRRLQQLRSLTGKVVKSRYTLDTSYASSSKELTANGGSFVGDFHLQTKRTVWCVKRHTIHVNNKLPIPEWSRGDGFNAAFLDDMTITLWNSMPWSWLVDYFIDVGGLLAATGNRIPGYSVEALNIMLKRETTYTTEARGLIRKDWNQATWSGNLTHTPLRAKRSTLERYNEAYPSPDFPDIAILDSSAFENLSFLALAYVGRSGGLSR